MRAIIGRLVLLAVAAVVVVGPVRVAVQAESYEHTPKTRQVKACILLLESFTRTFAGGDQMENPDPYVFYVLDTKAEKLKPRDWEIMNPLAPRVVTPDIKARWDAVDPGHPYTLNEPVTKSMGCYWEVTLSTTGIQDLLQFDLVGVMTHASGGFSPEDSAKLRRLVDQGATFWFDDCQGATLTANKPFFIRQFNYDYVGTVANPGSPTLAVADRLHPVLNSPFALTTQDLEMLGDKADQYAYRITNLTRTGPPDPALAPIVYTRANFGDGRTYAVTAGGHYGDGAVMITSGDIACSVNDRFVGGNAYQTIAGPNSGAYCGDLPANWDATAQAKLDCNMKFVFNLLNWTAGESNHRKGPHRAGYTRDEVTPGLDALWKVPLGPAVAGGAPVSLSTPPVVWRDFAFYGTNDGRVFAVDTRPSADRDGLDDNGSPRDGLGNPNDGLECGWVDAQGDDVADLRADTPYDVIWRFPQDLAANLGGRPSEMYVETVILDDTSVIPAVPVPVDVLFFTTGNGQLHALYATPTVPGQEVLASQTAELPRFPVSIDPTGTITAISPPLISRRGLAPDPLNDARRDRPLAYVVTREMALSATTGTYYLYVINVAHAVANVLGVNNVPGLVAKVALSDTVAGDNQTVLPAPTSALVENEATHGTADMVYATLPNGALASVAVHVHGEIADPREEWDSGRKEFYDKDPLIYRLQHAWIPTLDNNTVVYRANNTVNAPVTGVHVTPPDATNVADELKIKLAGGVPDGGRAVVDYDVDLTQASYNLVNHYSSRDLVWMPGYSATSVPARPTPMVLSGSGAAAGDANYYCGGSGYVQAVAERGERDLRNPPTPPALPSLWNLNYVFWRCNVNNYVEDTSARVGLAPYDRPGGFVRPSMTDGMGTTYSEIVWVPAWWTGAAWVPLPPAVTDRMVYVAMNRYALKVNGLNATYLLGSAVYALDQAESVTINLSKDALGTNVDLMNNLTTGFTVQSYQPEGTLSNPPQWADSTASWELRVDRDAAKNITGARLVSKGFGNNLSLCASLMLNGGGRTSCIWVDVDGGGTADVPRPFLPNGTLSNLAWRYPDPDWNEDATWPLTQQARAGWTAGVTAPPTVSGGVVYVGTADGRLFALDADPRDSMDPYTAGRPRPVDEGINDIANGFQRTGVDPSATLCVPPDVLAVWPQMDPQVVPTGAIRPSCPGGAVATGGLILQVRNEVTAAGVPKSGTLYALTRPTYAVADSRRVLEIDGDARVQSVIAEARTSSEQKALSHPAAAHSAGHLSMDGQATIFADAGNNRVVALDRGGDVVWEASEVYDLDNVLAPGEFDVVSSAHTPLVPGPGTFDAYTNVRVSKLRTPADVRSWESFDYITNADGTVTVNTNVKVQHTLIADAGNYRVMEIVDKWQWDATNLRWVRLQRTGDTVHQNPGNGVPPYWYHVVVWASQTRARHQDLAGQWVSGTNCRYTSLQVMEYYPPALGYGYARRVLTVVSNQAFSRAGGRRQQRLGTSLAILDVPRDATTGLPTSGKASLVDTAAEQGYTSAIGNSAYPTQPRAFTGLGTIQRYLFSWTAAGGPEWHYIYADPTGIYEWWPGANSTLPLDNNGHLAAASIYSQFWRENYEVCVRPDLAPAQRVGGDPRRFSPASVSISPAGGWIVVNREFDRTLSQVLTNAGRGGESRHIQAFKINSTPAPAGDYDPAAANFGYAAPSISWLFGPQVLDLRGRDLRMDLASPMFAVRWR